MPGGAAESGRVLPHRAAAEDVPAGAGAPAAAPDPLRRAARRRRHRHRLRQGARAGAGQAAGRRADHVGLAGKGKLLKTLAKGLHNHTFFEGFRWCAARPQCVLVPP